MTTIRCRGVLFDMDGVLVDSTPAVARVWTAWALEHGLVPEEVVRQAHGRPSLATIIELLPHGDHHAENREVERREIADIADVFALPGASRLLQTIPETRWTIVTSATRELAEVRLRAAASADKALIADARVFDRYEGPGVPEGKVSGGHHTPTFYAADDSVPIAMRLMTSLAVDYLNAGTP